MGLSNLAYLQGKGKQEIDFNGILIHQGIFHAEFGNCIQYLFF